LKPLNIYLYFMWGHIIYFLITIRGVPPLSVAKCYQASQNVILAKFTRMAKIS